MIALRLFQAFLFFLLIVNLECKLKVQVQKSELESYYERFKDLYLGLQTSSELMRQQIISSLTGDESKVQKLREFQNQLEAKSDLMNEQQDGKIRYDNEFSTKYQKTLKPEKVQYLDQGNSTHPHSSTFLRAENKFELRGFKLTEENTENPEGGERRVLQPTTFVTRMSGECFGQGRKVVIQDLYPFCNDKFVSMEEYDELEAEDPNQCTMYYRNRESCFCPSDRYGPRCEGIKYIECKLIRPTKEEIEQNCPAKRLDTFEYVGTLDGYPPCRYLSRGSVLDQEMILKCENMKVGTTLQEQVYGNFSQYFNVRWDVKVLDTTTGNLVDPVSPQQTPFSYFHNYVNESFVTSYDSDYWVTLQGIYWDKINLPYQIDFGLNSDTPFNLSLAQMKDSQPFNIYLNLNVIPKGLSQFGRYTFQLSTQVYIKDPSVIYTRNTSTGPRPPNQRLYNSETILLFYEDSGYSAGTISIPLTSGQVAGIVIGCVLFFLLSIYLIRVYLHHKKQKEAFNNRVDFLDQIEPINN